MPLLCPLWDARGVLKTSKQTPMIIGNPLYVVKGLVALLRPQKAVRCRQLESAYFSSIPSLSPHWGCAFPAPASWFFLGSCLCFSPNEVLNAQQDGPAINPINRIKGSDKVPREMDLCYKLHQLAVKNSFLFFRQSHRIPL